MILGFCRKPYPDELLYGYIYSIFLANGYSNMAQILHAIGTGKIGVNYAVGLPFIAESIINVTFPTIEKLIEMIPIKSFLDAECALQPEKICFPIHKPKEKIYVCLECIREDKEKYGEAILHLSHHRGLKKCIVHGCDLLWTNVPAVNKTIIPFDEYKYESFSLVNNDEYIPEIKEDYIWSLCDKCGKVYLEHIESVRRGTGCPHCNMSTAPEEIIQRMLDTMYDGEYRIIGNINSLCSALVKHIPCGIISKKCRQLLNYKQSECKECKRLIPRYLQRRFDPQESEWIFQNTNKADLMRRRIKVLHKVCGKENYLFMPQFTSKEGGYCPVCDNPQKTIEIEDVDPDYEIVGDYHNNRESVQIRHKTCGICFEVSKTSFLAGARCPLCTPRYSFSDVKSAVEECCPGWSIRKEKKRGIVSVILPTGDIRKGYSYGAIMADLKSEFVRIFKNRTKRWNDPESIRKRIFDRITIATRNKGYWNFADGLDEVTDPSMPGGVSRERRNIIQDMAKEGFIERCGRGCYRVVK